jgi:hypothetical protein
MFFEIHITALSQHDDPTGMGMANFHSAAHYKGLRTISVELLHPNLTVLRTEDMTSHRAEFETFEECKEFVDIMADHLHMAAGVVRVKIESPYYPEYVGKSCYIESHWTPEILTEDYPLSRSCHKRHKILATAREYDQSKFEEFNETWKGKGIVELCLYDSFVKEDKDWFDLYQKVEHV